MRNAAPVSQITILICASIAFYSSCVAVHAQTYPNKPIRMLTSGVGGAADLAARAMTQGLSASLGNQVIVDNRPSGVLPGEIVSKASPDGYTLLITGTSLWVGPLMQKTSYDALRDFSPVVMVVTTPNILIVAPQVPAKSVKELIALAKAKPGTLNYATTGAGSSNHLAAELFKSMAAVDIVRIPYKSNSAAMADLIGGQVQLTFATAGATSALLKSGRVKALAVSSAEPSVLFPDLPTIAASGLPGYESASSIAILAPAQTPTAIIRKLHDTVVALLIKTDIKEHLIAMSLEPVGGTPEQLAAKIRSDIAKLGKVINDANIRID